MNDCPSDETLAVFAQAPRVGFPAALRAHIDGCTHCSGWLADAEANAQLWPTVRRALQSPDQLEETVVGPRRSEQGVVRCGAYGPPPVVRDLNVLRHIASGGFADIWLARDEAGFVVIKCIRDELSAQELVSLRLFKDLADDPAIGLIPIHHIGRCEATGRLYYTMPPADPLYERTLEPDGYRPATLSAVLLDRGSLPPAEIHEVSRCVLGALEKIHGRGLVHRDIKPSNILKCYGRWCLGDTGLLIREEMLGAAVSAGTPSFLPPEGRVLDRSADLFAYGKTLQAMRCHGPVEAAQRGAARSVKWIDRVIDKACYAERARRYQSAAAMAADLHLTPARNVGRSVIGLAGVVLLLSVWGFMRSSTASPEHIDRVMWDSEVETNVVAFDSVGTELWRHELPGRREGADPINLINLVDGSQRVIATTRGGESVPSFLVMLTATGEELRRASFGDGYIYDECDGSDNSPNWMFPRRVLLADLNGDGVDEIIASAAHNLTFPGRLSIWDVHGNHLATYWNVGHIVDRIRVFDMDPNDGFRDLACLVFNNRADVIPGTALVRGSGETNASRMHQAVLILRGADLFSGRRPWMGRSPPYYLGSETGPAGGHYAYAILDQDYERLGWRGNDHSWFRHDPADQTMRVFVEALGGDSFAFVFDPRLQQVTQEFPDGARERPFHRLVFIDADGTAAPAPDADESRK